MNLFVGLTDHNWYTNLISLAPDEVNFWWPSGKTAFKALKPGEPFLFKAEAPHKGIIGGGFFVRYVAAPASPFALTSIDYLTLATSRLTRI